MHILQLSLHSLFDPTRVATGNQVREVGLRDALQTAGHRVSVLRQREPDAATEAGTYVDARDLQRQVAALQPDALLVGYWSLLERLPSLDVPVILDCIAPRLLEAQYQAEGTLQHEARRLLALLPRADHFLVANQRQADLLLPLLLLAGFDCRARAPISQLPIATRGPPPGYQAPTDRIRLVSAGVDWPWRDSSEYMALLERWCDAQPRFELIRVGGSYPGSDDAGGTLLAHADMSQLFRNCHLGLELGKRNTEREFSQSFRMIEYLQAGLPVLANSWLPAASQLRAYDAGWLVDGPDDVPAVLAEIAADPDSLVRKAAGAARLAQECWHYAAVVQPLLMYLTAPWRPARERTLLARSGRDGADVMVPRAPGRFWRLRSALVQGYRLLFCRHRPVERPDIVMVTRPDLFPTNHGAAVKIVRTAESLSQFGRRIWLCTDNRREYYCFEQGVMRTLRYPLWLRLLALPRRLALLRLLLRGYPWSNAFLYYPLTDFSYGLRTLYLSTRNPVGSWIAEFPAYVQPCRLARKLLGGRIVLVEHNVEYERLREQIADLEPGSYEIFKRCELRMCRSADAVITVSDNDREQLLRDGVEPHKLHTIPHGVDVAGFQRGQPAGVRRQYGIESDALLLVYHGPYTYAPNLQAMRVMARELLPELARRGLKVQVLAIGTLPQDTALHPDIRFIGATETLADVLPAADLAVVPLREGGGTRMKILDYFAAGVPVISTAKGIEGIPIQDGREALIRDDSSAICAEVERLAADPAARAALVAAASAFVATLSWDAIAERYLPLLGKVERRP